MHLFEPHIDDVHHVLKVCLICDQKQLNYKYMYCFVNIHNTCDITFISIYILFAE